MAHGQHGQTDTGMQSLGTFTLRGKRYQIVRVRQPLIVDGMECDGTCEPRDLPRPKIRVVHGLNDERELDVFIHEMLHACFWDLDETPITEAATDIASVLFKLGYRKHGHQT